MRQFFKRLLLPVAVAAVTQTSVVSAEGIRLLGPSGQVQSAPQYNSEVVRNTQAVAAENQPARFFGPTTARDTLWSIATELRPSTRVSVQQTLLAIYRLNPQAFENQNIHTLIPGSTLRIPSLAQVQRATTQEAVRVMQAHQARLANETRTPTPTTAPSTPVTQTPKSAVDTTTKAASTQTQVENTANKEAATLQKELTSSQSELLALEEKNHRLRLMLSDVQTEVTDLKQQLGDENRIRSEVEKLLAEEKLKREEAARLAPSSMDRLLSNTWLVAGLALIPGVLIALLIVMLLNRRAGKNEEETEILEQPAPVTDEPITLGDEPMDMDDDDLKLDEDLFGDSDDLGEEALFDDSVTDENEEEDLLSELSTDDIDFDLGDEDGEDLFAGIGDDGDLDDDLSNSVLEDEPAIGLDEMQRTLDEEADEAGSDIFDLSDDDDNSAISQDDIEDLLAGDTDEGEDLDSDSLDQSLLDELLASGESDPSDEEVDFSSFLDDDDAATTNELDLGEGALDDDNDLDLSDSLASDDELDSLFDNIESQADLETLEKEALDESELSAELATSEEEELLNQLLDEEAGGSDAPIVEDDSVALLDELLQEPEDLQHAEEDDDLLAKLETGETLDELLNEDDAEEDFDLSDDSIELLDEFIDEESSSNDLNLAEDPDLLAMEKESPEAGEDTDGVDLFDELLEIEQSTAEQEEPEQLEESEDPEEPFDSEHFIDDLISNVPEQDPLLGEFDFAADSEQARSDDEFDFNPEIEGTESSTPEPVANEFGVPQADDWLIDDEDEIAPLEEDAIFDLAEQELPENSDRDELEESESQPQPELETLEPQVDLDSDAEEDAEASPEIEHEEESVLAHQQPEEQQEDEVAPDGVELDEVDTPSVVEDEQVIPEPLEDVAEAPVEAEEQVEAVAPAESEVAEDEFALDDDFDLGELELGDEELPEFTEEDALAAAADEPAEIAEAPVEAEEQVEPAAPAESEVAEDEFALDDFDLGELELGDEELPEFTEEDALAAAADEPAEIAEAPVEAEEQVEPAAPAESEVAEDEFALDDDFDLGELELGDEELPEFTEEDALAAAADEPAEIAEAPVEAKEQVEPAAPAESEVAEDEFALDDFDLGELELGDEELPEFTEEDALAAAADEPAEIAEAPVEAKEQVEPAAPAESEVAEDEFASDDDFDLGDLELGDEALPEFTEEDALAAAADEPAEIAEAPVEAEEQVEPAAPAESEVAEDEFALDDFDLGELELGDEELPEFTEEDALAAAADEPAEIAEAPVEAEEQVEPAAPAESEVAEDEFALDDFDLGELELGDEELPEFTEEDALAAAADEPAEIAEAPVEAEEQVEPAAPAESEVAEDEFALDDDFDLGELELGDEELPEFTEEDALAAAADEPAEIAEAPVEAKEQVEPAAPAESEVAEDEFALDDFDLGELELGDEELPEFTEEDALASVADEPGETLTEDPITDDEFELADFEVGEDELPEFTEEDALAAAFGESDEHAAQADDNNVLSNDADLDDEQVLSNEQLGEADSEPSQEKVAKSAGEIEQEYQEQSLNNWLDETQSEQAPFRFDQPIDARTIDSAGMDLDAMLEVGGEDWNGFNLTPEQQAEIPDDVPAEEEAVWNDTIQNQSPEVSEENWGQQENIENYEPNKKYMTIDELMAQVEEDDERFNPDDEDLKLDVGLNEFPDVIGAISNVDVDLNAEAAGKLDLAKMYVEMNDNKGAIKLLEEAIVDGDDEIRRQAKHLIDVLNGRA